MVKNSILKNNKGLTLVEILIATAIITVSAFSVLQIIRVAQSSLSSVSRQLTFDVVKMNVGSMLNYSSDCFNALNDGAGGQFNYSGAPVQLAELGVGGDVIVRSNTVVDGVLFKEIIVRPVPGIQPVTTSSQRYHLAELVLMGEKQGDITGSRVVSNENNPFRFYIITDLTNRMVSCSAGGFLDALKTCRSNGLPLARTINENGTNYNVYRVGTTVGYAPVNSQLKEESETAKPVCKVFPEGAQPQELKCPGNKRIKKFSYVNFGTQTGSCGPPSTLRPGGCSAPTSNAETIRDCYAKNTCNVVADRSVYGDPCRGVGKSLAVVAVCEDIDKITIPEGVDPDGPDPVPTPLPTPVPTGLAAYCVTKNNETQGTVALCIANKKCLWEGTNN